MSNPSPDLPDLTGQTAVVTGGGGGIGAATATALHSQGATVVLAVRNPPTTLSRADSIGLRERCSVLPLDLADLKSVRSFADSWDGPIDLLINNAGVWTPELKRTADGFELQFGTNHLGHFALTNLLLPHLVGRVVTVSSQAERVGRLDFNDLNWERTPYNSSAAYNNSKLANLLFSSTLQRKLETRKSPVLSLAAHPGLVRTGIYDSYTNRAGKLLVRLLAQDPDQGALPLLLAALGKVPGGAFTGPEHFAHMRGGAQIIKRSRRARDLGLADRLWSESERLTGVSAFT